MSRLESMPSEIKHTTSAPVSLDIDQRLNLLHELRDLSNELQEDPFVNPYQLTTELSGVRLRSDNKNTPASYLSLTTTESADKPPFTQISLTGNKAENKEQRTYIHRPSLRVWEELRPGMDEPFRILGNSALITALEPRLPAGTVESIMDSSLEDVNIAQVLATHLQEKARINKTKTHYRAHGIEVGTLAHSLDIETPIFTRDTDFIIATNNARTSYNLFIAASFLLDDFGEIRKTCHYEAADKNGYLESVSGGLSIATDATTPASRRNAFVQYDRARDTASYTIGVNDIRAAYHGTHTNVQ